MYKLQIATNSTNFQQLQDVYNVTNTVVSNLRTDDNFYCFRLGAFDPCNNITVYSNVICSSNFDVTPQSDLNRLTWVTSSTGVANYAISKTGSAPLSAVATDSSLDDTNVICGTRLLLSDYIQLHERKQEYLAGKMRNSILFKNSSRTSERFIHRWRR